MAHRKIYVYVQIVFLCSHRIIYTFQPTYVTRFRSENNKARRMEQQVAAASNDTPTLKSRRFSSRGNVSVIDTRATQRIDRREKGFKEEKTEGGIERGSRGRRCRVLARKTFVRPRRSDRRTICRKYEPLFHRVVALRGG